MDIGKTLFPQLMDFLPWSTFSRIVPVGASVGARSFDHCGGEDAHVA